MTDIDRDKQRETDRQRTNPLPAEYGLNIAPMIASVASEACKTSLSNQHSKMYLKRNIMKLIITKLVKMTHL